MFKFIHIGDVHLDTTFNSKNQEIREKLRQSLREAFLEVIETCIKEEVHALLIAGDLFDNSQLSFQTEELLVNSFKKLKEHHIQVYYATGNHDPGDEKMRASNISWPDNVTLFRKDEIIIAETLDHHGEPLAKIVGVGHKNAKEARNLIKDFPVKEGSLPYVGLVHTMVTNATGVEKHDRYLPCTKEDLQEKLYDYWALGHIHQCQSIGEDNPIYYSGNLQGRHPRETGEKGGLLVSLQPNREPKVEFRRFSKIHWNTLILKGLEEIDTYSQLKDSIVESIDNKIAEGVLNNTQLLRIQLEGRSKLKELLEIEENITQLEEDIKYHFNFLGVEVKTEELTALLEVEIYREGENVLAKTLQLLEKLDQEEVLLERLLKLNYANKVAKTPIDKLQYIKELTEKLPTEAVQRMVGEVK